MTHPRSVSTFALAALIGLASLAGSATRAAAFTQAEAKAPMTVTLVRSDAKDCGTNCPEWIALTGKILPQTPALLKTAFGRAGSKHIPILIDSPGGSVEAALAMGRMIRARKLDVAVAGTALTDCSSGDGACLLRARHGERPGYVAAGIAACASACVFVLAAGTDRVVGHDSYVGVHQMIANRTLTRVINTFRILRKLVRGRVVEVSRTLIATRPVSSRVVTSAASTQTYSEVDHYLLGMGIDESIMPLMHATPPTGIHWMTPWELASTRIVTDTTDAQTLVARGSAKPEAPGPAVVYGPEEVSLAIGNDPAQEGTVSWHIDRGASVASGGPSLTGEIAIPEQHLHGSLTVTRVTDPAVGASFMIKAHIDGRSGAADLAVSSIASPKICDAVNCEAAAVQGVVTKSASTDYVFYVSLARGDLFLSQLRDRTWLAFPVVYSDGRSGEVGLSLSGEARQAMGQWESFCCGLAPPAPLSSSSVVPSVQTVRPTEPRVTTAGQHVQTGGLAPPGSTTIEDAATLTMTTGSLPPTSVRYAGTATWILLKTPAKPGPPGVSNLIATAEVPAAGIRVTLGAGIADRPDGHGYVAIDVRVEANNHRVIGPLVSLTQVPVPLPGGGFGLYPDKVTPISVADYEAFVHVPTNGAIGAEIRIVLGDDSGRFATLSLPISEAVGDLIRADARASAALAD